jgi:hypothetical protein
MHRKLERFIVVALLVLTAAWPVALAGLLAGESGARVMIMAYLSLGGLLFGFVVLGGIRGVFSH